MSPLLMNSTDHFGGGAAKMNVDFIMFLPELLKDLCELF